MQEYNNHRNIKHKEEKKQTEQKREMDIKDAITPLLQELSQLGKEW